MLQSFDTRVEATRRRAVFQNGDRARSYNRQLRSRLTRAYCAFLSAAHDASSSKRERFVAAQREYETLVAAFIAQCEGGPLAWSAFGMLQESLRLEQAAALQQLFRDEIRAGEGGALPDLSPRATSAAALVALLEEGARRGGARLPAAAVPTWLVALSREEQGLAGGAGANHNQGGGGPRLRDV